MSYQDFLASKRVIDAPTGLADPPALNPMLFDFQRDITAWALRRGRAALFEDCGLGKTAQQLVWADEVVKATNKPVLILAPLAVSDQTAREAAKFGIEATYCRAQAQVKTGITVTNYEMLDAFDPAAFAGVVLDESSILKAFMGATKIKLLNAFNRIPYRLACTATPAPNDHMELGNHAEFLGIMPSNEMLARWFINDAAHVGRYKIKGHAERDFWQWVASWAVCIAKPSDLGGNDDGFILPPLNLQEQIVTVDGADFFEADSFLPKPTLNATEIHRVMRQTAAVRAEKAAELALATAGPFILWCNSDYEADAIAEVLPEAVGVRGSESVEAKREKLSGFSQGHFRVIVTKPRIAGFGLNWQHCANMAFVGLSYSYEQFYQAICRSYRFGQTRPVNATVIVADSEVGVLDTIRRKRLDHQRMQLAMVDAMRDFEQENVRAAGRKSLTAYQSNASIKIPDWMNTHAAA